ncbi:acyltransferase [Pseudoalteromonas sp. JBTF-M23]|uniref:Acyltransferase n=1 Tax=Pseudoalteromonas caenipelagi TaxID=2726988 RepID=A0A849V9M5_9GAMM|nr:acyltransferase family protein [Pseudoalteromonas caenipelagi]NOU49598.1 acyltransferase [Pseudoalteromonas caenipelagi]
MYFRYDINGLRALAVISVVIFHFNDHWLPGGFAGVDIFFVLSGFLMTSIIVKAVDTNSFSFANFYLSRFNRLVPALLFVCVALLVITSFFVLPLEFKDLGKHVLASMLFISNIIYFRESGYFDVDSAQKWLLHTWSLSVEWQFYLIYPILLLLLCKLLSRKYLPITLSILTAGFFIFSVMVTKRSPNEAYFMLQTRAWELMIGGIVFFCNYNLPERTRSFLYYVGLSLVLLSFFIFNKQTPWPGIYAFTPVFGTCLVLIANKQNLLFEKNAAIQALGQWSYSIYLWHWPVVVFMTYWGFKGGYILGIAVSIFLGYLSYKLIESQRHFKVDRISRLVFSKLSFVGLIVLLISFSSFRTQGFLFLHADKIQQLAAAKTDLNPRKKECFHLKSGSCKFGDDEPSFILLGDSHSLSVATALLEGTKKSFTYYGYGSCNTMFGEFTNLESPDCNVFNDRVYREIKSNNLPVIVVNSGAYPVGDAYMRHPDKFDIEPIVKFDKLGDYRTHYINRFSDSMCRLKHDREVYVFTPLPRMQSNVPDHMMKEYHRLGYVNEYTIQKQQYLDTHKIIFEAQEVAKRRCDIKLVDATQALCSEQFCFGSSEKFPLYSDTNHLTEHGAQKLIPIIRETIIL